MNFMYRKNECKLLLINSLHALIPLTFIGKGQGMFYTLFKIFINNTKEKKVLFTEEVLYYPFAEFNMPYCIAIKIIQKMQLRLCSFQNFCLILIVSYIEIYILI